MHTTLEVVLAILLAAVLVLDVLWLVFLYVGYRLMVFEVNVADSQTNVIRFPKKKGE
jgi:hypothetical protein